MSLGANNFCLLNTLGNLLMRSVMSVKLRQLPVEMRGQRKNSGSQFSGESVEERISASYSL